MKKYSIDESNFLCHELIGLKAKVIESTDASRVGTAGRIVDETMNVLVIETKNGEKKIPKKEVTLKLWLPNKKSVAVQGERIAIRPEDRVKALIGRK